MLNQQCCCGWRFRHTTIVLDAKSCMVLVGLGIFMADFSVCVCVLWSRVENDEYNIKYVVDVYP